MIKLKRCDGMCLILREYLCSLCAGRFLRIYFRGARSFVVRPQNADFFFLFISLHNLSSAGGMMLFLEARDSEMQIE